MNRHRDHDSRSQARRPRAGGVLPLVALLFFLNSAVCYCLSFGHEHGNGRHAATELPAPHECDCVSQATPLQADGELPLTGPALVSTLQAVALPGPCDAPRTGRPQIEVRPPGEHAPPAFTLHCSLLC